MLTSRSTSDDNSENADQLPDLIFTSGAMALIFGMLYTAVEGIIAHLCARLHIVRLTPVDQRSLSHKAQVLVSKLALATYPLIAEANKYTSLI